MTAARILDVHRPTGYQHGGWPTCTGCGDPYPCFDVLRIIEQKDQR